jgi:hypothetical protein
LPEWALTEYCGPRDDALVASARAELGKSAGALEEITLTKTAHFKVALKLASLLGKVTAPPRRRFESSSTTTWWSRATGVRARACTPAEKKRRVKGRTGIGKLAGLTAADTMVLQTGAFDSSLSWDTVEKPIGRGLARRLRRASRQASQCRDARRGDERSGRERPHEYESNKVPEG